MLMRIMLPSLILVVTTNNPVYAYYVVTQRFDYAVSSTVTDKLTALGDPRIGSLVIIQKVSLMD
jgi:hypothetical protein